MKAVIKENNMKKIAVIIANGTEELEALTPVDVLRRADVKVELISVLDKTITGSHGIKIVADKVVEEVELTDYDCIVIPGGMPGATNISNNEKVISALKKANENNKLIASICASPAVVLAQHNLLADKKATCYNTEVFVKALAENYTGSDVEVCENLITANGPKSAFKFSLSICEKLGLIPKF